ncbi:Na+ channel, amiloride-sensitive family-containing protein [Strongyloides ratti]|uniref:Na+ channel, amiloride-sensitive family-containing protein n=1 Tax=Strongyloides ratti TaxID=34506 RepID=A0A090KZ19_STRRB|nr:Na+ channel, amiloride-sensitive family-containing protein [Strongyloides ratti]CEF62740.1 Na+ channel, amiloride-sensitive family-containing protein [Strongyloides ratti]
MSIQIESGFLSTTKMTTSKVSDTSSGTRLSFCEKYYATSTKNFIDQFADDTKMLGFRYLHSRYRSWFRIMWGAFLFMALTLTIYQVVERISYYLFKNPLTSKRSFETLSSIPFPTIVLCNKMQLKASKVASYNPKLLSLMSEMFRDDNIEEIDENNRRNISDIMDKIKNLGENNFLKIYQNSHQSVDDFIVSCQYGRKKQCIDNINIILTPNGVCFAVSPNVTVTRPGPESTLSLLLNLEGYDTIPGWVPDSGVILSIYDANYTTTRLYDDGFHLEGGKLVTIPINDIRSLQRHPTECGKSLLDKDKEYSKQACQWYDKSQIIENTCGCVPSISPRNKKFFIDFNLKNDYGIFNSTLQPCALEHEYECVRTFIDNYNDENNTYCPEDCYDVRYNTIVFGNELDVNEISNLLPVNWEDEKEKKIKQFFKAIKLIPKNRIPIIKSIQKLATDAQNYVTSITEILGTFKNIDIIKNVDVIDVSSCEAVINPNILPTILKEINGNEKIWKNYIIYFNYVFKPNIIWLLKVFNLHDENNMTFNMKNYTNKYDILDKALIELRLLSKSLHDPEKLFGLKSMSIDERNLVVRHVKNLINNTNLCIEKWEKDNNENSTTSILLKCQETFKKYFHPLEVGKDISIILSSQNITHHFFRMIKNLTDTIDKATSKDGAQIFNYKNYNIDINKFQNEYRDDGKELGIVFEVLKNRKYFQNKITEVVNDITDTIESFIKGRELFYINNSLINNKNEIIFLNNSIECFKEFLINIQTLRKYPFMRGDWMIRLQRDVLIAQSYSSGQEFDKVNLLHVKLYFTHIKREMIINVKSYNLFLLLAEIGGTIGLYVGATLLTVAETIVFLFENHVKTKKFLTKKVCNVKEDL